MSFYPPLLITNALVFLAAGSSLGFISRLQDKRHDLPVKHLGSIFDGDPVDDRVVNLDRDRLGTHPKAKGALQLDDILQLVLLDFPAEHIDDRLCRLQMASASHADVQRLHNCSSFSMRTGTPL